MIIEGAISVKSAIQNHNRDVYNLYINKDKKTKDFNYIRKIARENNIVINELPDDELGKYLKGRSHGGVGAEVSLRKQNEFVDGDIFYLDGIEDPYNLGYALRTLYAFGIKNVLLSERDYSTMETQILKSSAGAYDMLKIRIADDPVSLISSFKDTHYIYALYRGENAEDIFETKFKPQAVFMLGGEKRGISADLLKLCDKQLYISYGSDFRNALNACGALDVVATLLYAQRKKQ